MAKKKKKPAARSIGRSAPGASARAGASRRASRAAVVTKARREQGEHAVVRERQLSPRETQSYRELFWQNVMREVLVSLMMTASKDESTPPPPAHANVLDGRLGLITHSGQRIPIARVFPVFAASVAQTPRELAMSVLLQCTVFQVHTPGGEVFTLPLHEIRGFHALTEELMAQLENNARSEARSESAQQEPFGFAAFTSLSRSQLAPRGEEGKEDDADDDEPAQAAL